MILQALTAYYEDLVAKGTISSPGWGSAKTSFAIYLNDEGEVIQTASIMTEQPRGKKSILAPMVLDHIPAQVKRSVGILPNFLCDNSSYILGVDTKGKPERSRQCFEACGELHHKILDGLNDPAANAVLRYFDTWNPEKAPNHQALTAYWESLISGGNLVFRYKGEYLHEIPAIASAWERYYFEAAAGPEMVCLITGRKGPVEAIHPAIKGIKGAQSSGAALISFNADAFTSYGKEQNYNAPVCQYAAFAYTTALNHLIADREHVYYVGDTAVLCWAQGAEKAYQDLLCINLLGQPSTYSDQDIRDKVQQLVKGNPVEFDEARLEPGRTFYVLGIAPNAARLSVRFFLKDSFGNIMEHVAEHNRRLEIIRPNYDSFPTIPMWKLLEETVNQKSKDKTPSPNMAGDLLRSVLQGTRYPATLLNGVTLRIRAEHEITRGRAAIIKAYYLKNVHPDVPEEVLQVSLNQESTNIPYNLGRLFSILEQIQSAANPGINSTIRDKYFNSASATPAMVFPVLINLAQKHLRVIREEGHRIFFEKNLGVIMEKLGEEFPVRLNLAQRGAFQLGYYHQTQARYQSKAKEEK